MLYPQNVEQATTDVHELFLHHLTPHELFLLHSPPLGPLLAHWWLVPRHRPADLRPVSYTKLAFLHSHQHLGERAADTDVSPIERSWVGFSFIQKLRRLPHCTFLWLYRMHSLYTVREFIMTFSQVCIVYFAHIDTPSINLPHLCLCLPTALLPLPKQSPFYC